jgi:hypothetical protein
MDILKEIESLINNGFSKSDIEYLSRISKNSLSSILSGKKNLSKKNELRLKRFLDSDIPDPLTFKKEDIIATASKNISRIKGKDYAPDVHEIQKEVDKIVINPKKEKLEKLIKAPVTKGYFRGAPLPDFDPEVGYEGISDPNCNF